MRIVIVIVTTLIVLSGCSATTNRDINTLQFDGTTEPYPADYLVRARSIASDYGLPSSDALEVSAPRTMVGATAFSPQRWYVCIRGLSAIPGQGVQPPSPEVPHLFDTLGDLQALSAWPDSQQLIVVFRTGERPFVIGAVDSPLCGSGTFTSLHV